MTQMKSALKTLEEQGRYRCVSLPSGVDLSSNDYLGLANSQYLRTKAIEHLQNSDMMIGAAGSRLLRGHHESHEKLEKTACNFFKSPASLYFSSGFQANYGVITTLCGRHDQIIYDELVHASTRDAIAACHSKAFKVAHNDINDFEEQLKQAQSSRRKDSQIWIAVESLYSMEGDIAPLRELSALAKTYDACLILDEAHATGVYGEQGRGLAHGNGAPDYEHTIIVHTCGKALGVAGGLVCASKDTIDYLINKSRPFIYSTAPMPLQAELVKDAIDWLGTVDADKARSDLMSLCQASKKEWGGAGTQIIPLMIGEDSKAVQMAEYLQKQGFDIRAVRPPSVPVGTARLRLSLSATLELSTLSAFMKHYTKLI